MPTLSAKVRNNSVNLNRFSPKYTFYFALALAAACVLLCGNPSFGLQSAGDYAVGQRDSLSDIDVSPAKDAEAAERQLEQRKLEADSLIDIIDSALLAPVKRDTAAVKPAKSFLDDPISGTANDSLVYDPRRKLVYIYEKGDVIYLDKNLKADFIRVDMSSKLIYAHGRPDSIPETGKWETTHPEFIDGGSIYKTDTITYNLASKKAKIKGLSTQDGEGFLLGRDIKKMPDNTINIAHGRYTTCDHVESPHFYLAMTRAKAIPGKKVIVGPSYLVFEDVPIYFLGVPFAFFPMMSDRSSGFIMPEYGEDTYRGFFLRNGGYYFAFNDYIDATLTGGIYSLGSWEVNGASNYRKRYKYNGNFMGNYSKIIGGEKGSADYSKTTSYNVRWSHSQDPKFRPNSTFSASVNFSSSSYAKRGAQTLADHLSTQTNSSIAYSTRWGQGRYSLSVAATHSQNSADTTMSIGFPSATFSVMKFYPFRREERSGKERWYEKISMSYTGNMRNTASGKEYDMFTDKMFRNMVNGVEHSIPVSMSFNLLNYINLSPSANYNETWSFKAFNKEYDPAQGRAVVADTTFGFYRAYRYSFSASMSTKLYGMYEFTGKKFPIRFIRHVITTSAGMSFSPDFSDPKFGMYKPVQSDSTGTITYYSPMQGAGAYSPPGTGRSASLSFSLGNNIEMKVRSKADTSGMKKIKIIENLSASSSYNFLADSLNLSPFSLNLRTGTLFGNFALQLGATLDPYQLNDKGHKINKFMLAKGKLGRITSTGWSFGYTFQSTKKATGAMNDINNGGSLPPGSDPMFFTDPSVNASMRRQAMSSMYYDFDIPWNLGVNYSLSYSKPGLKANVTQTLRFNTSVTLTEKTGITFDGGYDFKMKKFTPGTVNITRDLHCWQMTFSWVPIGSFQSWSFYIGVKSGVLHDLKYDKRSSYYENLYD